jgi:hypothetical protein
MTRELTLDAIPVDMVRGIEAPFALYLLVAQSAGRRDWG